MYSPDSTLPKSAQMKKPEVKAEITGLQVIKKKKKPARPQPSGSSVKSKKIHS